MKLAVTSSHLRRILIAAIALVALAALAPGAASADTASVDVSGLSPDVGISGDGLVLDAANLAVPVNAEDGAAGVVPAGLLPEVILDEVVPPVVPPGGDRSVIGSDGRWQVTNTTSYPYSAIVHITSNQGSCTGWLYGRDTVATAGHCLHSGGSGGSWVNVGSITVTPARNGWSAPYGSCSARQVYSVLGWTRDNSYNYDYGSIKLNCTVGDYTGWFGYYWNDASRVNNWMYVTGYPGDKSWGTMWGMGGYIHTENSRRLYYSLDTAPGQSGSPLYHYINSSYCGGYCSNGIHSYGVGGGGSSYYNSATRINSPVFNNLYNWKYYG